MNLNSVLEIAIYVTPIRLLMTLALVFITAWAYNAEVVDPLEQDASGKWAHAAWEVVGGVSLVILIFAIGVDSLAAGMLLYLYFIFAGIPMIRGSDRRAKARRRNGKAS